MHYVGTVYQGKTISEDETWTNSNLIYIKIACSCFLDKCWYPLCMYEGLNLGFTVLSEHIISELQE